MQKWAQQLEHHHQNSRHRSTISRRGGNAPKSLRAEPSGFTIVELLIVVVVIAILAAITLIAFNNITSRAKNSAAASAAQQAFKKVAVYAVDNAEQLPPDLATAGITNQNGTTYQYRTYNTNKYCITATANNISSYIDNDTHTTPTAGACDGHGVNGVLPITNLVKNPSYETGISGWGVSGGATLVQSAWSQSGSKSAQLTGSGGSNDTYISQSQGAPDNTAFNLQPNTTYTFSAYGKVVTAGTGTTSGNGALQITCFVHNGTAYTLYKGNQLANTVGATGRSVVTFTTPATITQGFIRLYLGYATGSVQWDAVMLTQGSTTPNYADGDTSSWVWNGAASSATSTGPAL